MESSRSADPAKPETPTLDLTASADPVGPKDLLLIFDIYLTGGDGRIFSAMESKDLYIAVWNPNAPMLETVKSFLKEDGVPWHSTSYHIVAPGGVTVRSSRTLKFLLEMLAQAGQKKSFWTIDHPSEQSPSRIELAELTAPLGVETREPRGLE